MEQQANPYVNRFIELDHFFVRNVMLVKYSCGFVVMPGGFGTLNEAFETLTLVQCNKLVRGALVSEETISPEDLDLLHMTDSADEVIAYLKSGTVGIISAKAQID